MTTRTWTGPVRALTALTVTAVFILPVYLVLANTFKPGTEIFAHPGTLPLHPTLDNIRNVTGRADHLFWAGLLNSVQVTALSVILSTVLSAMLAHYLVRTKTRGARLIAVLILAGLMIPSAVTLQPITEVLGQLHLMGTVLGLVLVNVAANLPFGALLFMGFIKNIPLDLEEAAALDGAGPLRTFWSIVFPLLRPAAASVLIFTAVSVWNDFITPLIVLGPANGSTVTVGMYRQISEHVSDFGAVFAFMVLSTIPILILFLFFQRYFVKGLLGGATKG
ncbi:carbohydrate ABC transporter permease [Nonomuraea spiralis]|uniref:Carbohydrate ABC transporter permease n=1 Tax=Nonomuraea spiralis TaxID=46182 RepID=A0ABV5ISW8_9ACTN|nr:carbohydrate ABC transporter permease [Nonomuraea spiralis]GGT17043.1 sugar ABC transporter permease [Nonomuraea spiralis]